MSDPQKKNDDSRADRKRTWGDRTSEAEAQPDHDQGADAEATPEPDPTSTAEAGSTPTPDAAEKAPESGDSGGPMAALEAENADLKDQLLRALAEMENVRRRTAREREDATRFGNTAFARDLLPVADNLSRAIAAIPAERVAEDHDLRTLFEGVELVARDIDKAFEKHGIERVDPNGEPFDHNFHQALFEIEDKDRPAGTVAEVVAVGYTINGRLLRPAMVGVTKGGPKASKPEPDAPNGDDDVAVDEQPRREAG